jgi:Tfp pilus assembly protein PilF
VIRLDPENAEILYRRALVQFRHHDFAKAEHDLTWAIRIDPSFALAFFWRGTVRSSRGDKDGAVADWLRARELDPDSPLQIESYDRRPRRWWRR